MTLPSTRSGLLLATLGCLLAPTIGLAETRVMSMSDAVAPAAPANSADCCSSSDPTLNSAPDSATSRAASVYSATLGGTALRFPGEPAAAPKADDLAPDTAAPRESGWRRLLSRFIQLGGGGTR